MKLIIHAIILYLSLVALYGSELSFATPLIAIREANNCGACHTPGRAQRPVMWRRCTLDCQGCHIDPNGGSARNRWGEYYSKDQLNMVELVKPIDPLKDTTRFDLHYDGRIINRAEAGKSSTSPMASEFTFRLRPFITHLHLTYSALFLGRTDDKTFRFGPNDRFFREKYSIMVDQLPFNLYVRYGRGVPVYGQRRPNHSVWIRERIGLEQYALTDAFTVGGTLNVPFIHYSIMDGNPYKEPEDRQKGTSAHFGLRGVSFGWNVHASLWDTQSEKSKVAMQALGGGAHAFDILLMAEKNFRQVTELIPTSQQRAQYRYSGSYTHPSSEISEVTVAWTGVKGLMAGLVQEAYDTDQVSSDRTSLFVNVHPIPSLQVELWRRHEYGARDLWDTIAVLHLYADF